MYICKDCGAWFEEPLVISDDPSPSGVSLPSGCYEYEQCPECGSDDFEEAEMCPRCETYYLGKGRLCDTCTEDFGIALRDVRSQFRLLDEDFEELIRQYFGW